MFTQRTKSSKSPTERWLAHRENVAPEQQEPSFLQLRLSTSSCDVAPASILCHVEERSSWVGPLEEPKEGRGVRVWGGGQHQQLVHYSKSSAQWLLAIASCSLISLVEDS